MKRVAVLISGRGSNLQALIEAASAGRLGGVVAIVVSNVATATGLERARTAGVPAVVCEHRGKTRDEHEEQILAILQARQVDLICLAGYMRLLSAQFLRRFGGPILNVHPSLLPSFRGRDAQAQAWAYGVKLSGATVHLVDADLDAGPILSQEAVPVLDDDTPDDLAARILAVEHRIYPQAVRLVLEGRYAVAGRRVHRGA